MTATMQKADSEAAIEAIRDFNRFYTRQIGVLQEGLLKSEFSLTEVRILYELAHRRNPTAAELASDLSLDAGYLSRILQRFQKQGLLCKVPSETDGRQSLLSLTNKGQEVFGELNTRSQDEIRQMLDALSPHEQKRLIQAMATIRSILDDRAKPAEPFILRPHQVGDMGWITHRQGILYHEQFGWDETYEALVAEITAAFIQNYDPKRERCWVAERDGEIIGSVFVVKASDTVAKLRLLYVEPKARGLGLGTRLVSECIRFARQAGYQKMVLWTQSILTPARHIYKKAGFQRIQEEPHHSFGHDLVAETWELAL
jgi:DNA-binding MarR family transcriptional regulator/GNAT superfamily N-acetyltransferase